MRSVRGGLSLREGRRKAGKSDNLSFLGVFLSQMGEVMGDMNWYATLFEGGCQGFRQGMIFDPQKSISRRG
ncbi:MAG: hypothetical protein F4047_14430 [Caldilineaceae bacterium SB0670_bin_27]|uniref:Uncharacterized protein n=1 Tax=Caldilineaceae bacterium SB0664_bin_27 TaxID=2605260 RepID=A0A6B0YP36_9CHLR|nr:hypothetical protein [Caldilineaceae bacterium SB0664_bin_27]MYJ79305.1 hypothetical protein [Caldilineaceae bacterium SB0670_bin_27]